MEILDVEEQEGARKRFTLTMSEYGKLKKYQFGQPNGTTYIDGATKQVRDNYRKRHLANKTELHRITNLIPSPALFSYYILWGDTQDIIQNIKLLNEKFLMIGGSMSLSQKKQLIKKVYPNRTKELAEEQYKKLTELDCNKLKNISPFSKIGNVSVQYFTDVERMGVSGNKGKNYYEIFENWNKFTKKAYVKRFIEYMKQSNPQISKEQLTKSFYGLYEGGANIFKPLMAMNYYCKYKPISVLDFTMGWGGRLIGATALNVPHYIGIDMNTNLIKPYEEMVKMVKPYTTTKITLMFKNALSVDYNKLDYDMVFTSPPYYNIEKYSHMPTIKTKEEWNKTFYEPIITKTWDGLKKGGHYCLNVPIEVYENVCIKILGKADEKIPIIKIKRMKGGGENYKEYTYIWKKG